MVIVNSGGETGKDGRTGLRGGKRGGSSKGETFKKPSGPTITEGGDWESYCFSPSNLNPAGGGDETKP